jgi:hypothetical protein
MDETNDIDLNPYTSEHVDGFLASYRILVKDTPELAAQWEEMEDGERVHHQMMFAQTWGERWLLGQLYRAGRLTSEQAERLAELDLEWLNEADQASLCYDLDLGSLMQLFVWGTPLTERDEVVTLRVSAEALNDVTQALAFPSPVHPTQVAA